MASSKHRKQNEKAIRLVDYLLRVASLRTKLVRDIAEYDRTLWISAVPHEKGCFTQAWGRHEEYDSDVWVEVQNQREPELPGVPSLCRDWIDESSLRCKSDLSKRPGETVVAAPVAPQSANMRAPASATKSTIPPESTEQQISPAGQRIKERQGELFGGVIRSSTFQIGQRVRFTKGKRTGTEATVVSITSTGRPVLRTDNGIALGKNDGIIPKYLETVPCAIPQTATDSTRRVVTPTAECASAEESPTTNRSGRSSLESRSALPKLLPEITRQVKNPAWRVGSDQPEFISRTERLEDRPEVQRTWDRYVEERWSPWTKQHDAWESVHEVYSSLFAIHQEQRRLGEEYELVLGLGLLSWQTPSGQRVRRHLIVANALLEFEARLGKFTVRPIPDGASVRPELDMLDIEEQPAHAEETAKSSLANARDDPWEKDCIEGVLKALVHSINPEGEYTDNLKAERTPVSAKPIVEYSPGLILRKRSIKGLTETLKRIKKRIEKGEDIPTEFGDLAEVRPRNEADSVDDPGDTNSECGGEVFFPKPSNEEQRRIVDKIREASGVLVQGPPGTGKSHTIANLVCHLLATGQRVLITAKTPRALQVLMGRFDKQEQESEKGLIPGEIRPLCISLLGSGGEERKSLESSVGGILRKKEEWDESRATDERKKLEQKLRELREDKARVDRRLRDMRESETHSQSIAEGTYRGTAARIAQSVNQNRNQFEWFTDSVSPNQSCKITDNDLFDAIKCLRRFTLEKRHELDQIWPKADTLYTPKEFTRLVHCEKRLEEDEYDASHSFFVWRALFLSRARRRKRQAEDKIMQNEPAVAAEAAKKNAHPVAGELLQAIRNRNSDGFSRAYVTIQELTQEALLLHQGTETIERLRRTAPRLTEALERTCDDICWDTRIQQVRNAWRWAQARFWVEEYIRKEDAASLAKRAKQIEDEISDTIAKLASLHAWSFCFSRLQEDHQRHMQQWQWHMRKGGKFTGKHAPYHRREAQKHLNGCREAVPAWVMPLHRVWDTVDPAPGMFDVIIIDEASQCGVEALPLFYLGKKILIVGDDKQISPDAVGLPRDAVHRVMEEFLHDFRFKSSFDVESSLFDHGKLRYGTRRITLREHFRCMPEIICFSNDLCYSDTPLIPLRQYGPERLTPLEHVFVSGGYREGTGNRVVNRPEAEAVVERIVELCADKRYSGKTMGGVVLQGEAQAGLIEGQLLERLGAEEMEKRRLVCGNPYSFQGDERDIMFLSLVAASNERIGPLTKAADERRFNVAASRARDQMYLFHSVTCDDLSTSCLRRQLLEFFENTRPQEVAGINREELERRAAQDNRAVVKPPHPFESWFEVDVALELLRKGFVVLPQHKVADKRIDLVIEGGHARLAVECDGDVWHGPDHYEADMQRQRMLERCGWEFFRVRESAFRSNKDSALQGLWRALEERRIRPSAKTEKSEPQTPVQPDETVGSCEDGDSIESEETDQRNEGTERAIKVQVGSTVVYINEDNGRECQALITTETSNPEWGTINANTPIAKALLGAEVGHVVVAHLPLGSAQLRIVAIH